MLLKAIYTINLFILVQLFQVLDLSEGLFTSMRREGDIHEYEIILTHPGLNDQEEYEVTLFELRDSSGVSSVFYFEVESVICATNLCKIVPVKLIFTPLGEYLIYELKKGSNLEKGNGEAFTTIDYAKLDSILHQTESELESYDISELVEYSLDSNDVDAITGATVKLSENVSVRGATLTCFTLWHWVHGGVKEKIRNIFGDNLGTIGLTDQLQKGIEHKVFGLQQLGRLQDYSNKIEQIVFDQILMNESALFDEVQSYFAGISGQHFYEVQLELIKLIKDKDNRIDCLLAMKGSEEYADSCFWEETSLLITTLQSYREIDLFLDLLDEKSNNSQGIIQNLLPMLEKDFLIARRVYYYIAKQENTGDVKLKLEDFKRKNRAYL